MKGGKKIRLAGRKRKKKEECEDAHVYTLTYNIYQCSNEELWNTLTDLTLSERERERQGL